MFFMLYNINIINDTDRYSREYNRRATVNFKYDDLHAICFDGNEIESVAIVPMVRHDW